MSLKIPKSEILQRARLRWSQLRILSVKRVGRSFKYHARCFECQAKHWMAFNCSGRCKRCGNRVRAQRRHATMVRKVQGVIQSLLRNRRIALPWKPKQSGYVYVWGPKGQRTQRLHRMVMEAYLGHKLPENTHVHHRNGHKTDCRIQNLECRWCTTHGAGITRAEAKQFLKDTEPRRMR